MHFGPARTGEKPRLLLSFSGGRTSGYMTRMCLTKLVDQFEMLVVFANTGQENGQTLEFVRDCDRHFGFNTAWVEAVPFHGERKSSGHRVVTFETASRKGEPFEAMIQKYGIPNRNFPHCTRELKRNAINSYMESIGWADYATAIGVRPDEARRVNPKAVQQQIAYPLIDWFWADKQDVNDWWEGQTFDLRLREHEGNCAWCWKKSDAKHFLLIRERPTVYEFPARMESLYGYVGPMHKKDPDAPPHRFFRLGRSTQEMFAAAAAVGDQPVKVLERLAAVEDADANGGCTESCELYPMLDFGEVA
jgi:hypothetical protein